RQTLRQNIAQVARPLKEEVIAAVVAIEEAKIERLRRSFLGILRLLQRGVQAEPRPGFISEEKRNPLNRQRTQQAVRHRSQHAVHVRFRAQVAREFDQRKAIVVLVTIKDVPVQLFLKPAANRLKDEGGE